MSGTYDFVWDQGADLNIQLTYKVGADAASATPVNLTGYQFRMDIATTDAPPVRILTLNSDDIVGAPSGVDTTGPSDNEVTMDSNGVINVFISRIHTLTGGKIFDQMALAKFHFKYDMFLRNPGGLQHKLMQGTIAVNPSVTMWT